MAPFWGLRAPLIEVDDARYAQIPLEMNASRDWISPTLNGLDYVEKPPLWYWLAASSYQLFGVSEASARLPLALLSLLGILGTAWLGSWLVSPWVGLAAAVLLSSSGLYFYLSHFIGPDMGLAVFLLWSTAMILRCLIRPEDAGWAAPAAWAFAGLAFLSKGLVALLFPAGWTALLLVLFPQWRRPARSLMRPLGPLLFAALVLPWFIEMERRHEGFLHFFFAEQHFQRFLTGKYQRASPWYFFLLVLPAVLMPLTPAALEALAGAARGWKEKPGVTALAVWIGMIVAFFSTSQSKLASYMLPVMPHLALAAAAALERPPAPWSKRLAWSLGAILVFSPIILLLPVDGLAGFGARARWLGAASAVSMGAALLAYGRTRQTAPLLGLGGLLAGILFLGAVAASSDLLSARALAKAINDRSRPGDRIYAYGTYLHGVPFYTRRRVDKMVNWVGELHYAKRDPANAWRFGDDDDIRALPVPGARAFVAYRDFETPHLLTLAARGAVKERVTFGKWALAVYE